MIEFDKILKPGCTCIGVDVRSKKAILEEACERLANEFPDEVEPRRLLEGLLARERLGSTGLGEGVAIPHCRLEACDEPVACFMRTSSGIDFDGPDDRPVDLLLVLAVPLHEQRTHLEILGALARAFDDPANLGQLRRATTDRELFDVLQRQLVRSQQE
ncbi:MAG: PTS sugar transporter subunit IIA [Pseudomonadales bacterium]|nr:PTS sugar transporter subunit IIA [Pseudomonadales bacterium]